MPTQPVKKVLKQFPFRKEVYPTYVNKHEELIFCSREFYNKLDKIYRSIGLVNLEKDLSPIAVNLRKNRIDIHRMMYYLTEIKPIEKERPVLARIDKNHGYVEKEIFLATLPFMERFDVQRGEPITIFPYIPPSAMYI